VSNIRLTAYGHDRLRGTIVVVEKTTNALTAPDGAVVMLTSISIDQGVSQALMVTFAMIVHDELGEGTTEVLLTKRNQSIQALLLD
jgi:hypothetical protein